MCPAAFPDALDDIAPQDNHFRYCASTRIQTRHFLPTEEGGSPIPPSDRVLEQVGATSVSTRLSGCHVPHQVSRLNFMPRPYDGYRKPTYAFLAAVTHSRFSAPRHLISPPRTRLDTLSGRHEGTKMDTTRPDSASTD